MGLRPRSLLIALAVALGAGPASAELDEQDLADVARIDRYFNDITTLSARFVQIAPSGEVSEGDFFLRRPGRLRFEFAPPVPILIVADGFRLVFYDRELGQVSAWPVGATPLGPLLARTVGLAASGHAQSVARAPGLLRLTLIDPDRTDEGSLTLVFRDQPLELRQWEVTDVQGLMTVIALSGMRINPALDPQLFIFHDPDEEAEEMEKEAEEAEEAAQEDPAPAP